MQENEMNENRMFAQMLAAARERLRGRDPQTIALKTGIEYDAKEKVFHLLCLGDELRISYPHYDVQPEPDGWRKLLILHYMDLADGTPLLGQLAGFSQMKDGLVRGSGFDRRFEETLQQIMRRITAEELEKRCRAMGGLIQDGNADLNVILPFLPRIPLTLKIWMADDEFDASGRLMADASIDHYLTIEDAVTVGEVILERLMI